MTTTTTTSAATGPLNRMDILEIARRIARDRGVSIKLALAVIQNRLLIDKRFYESDLAFSLLDDLIKNPSLLRDLEQEEQQQLEEQEQQRKHICHISRLKTCSRLPIWEIRPPLGTPFA